MGRAPCCDKANVKRGPWSPEEDGKLKEYIEKHGTGGNWIALPQKAGLKRCGKSCRLRWLNYLRPDIRHGEFSDDEDRIICTLFANIGSRWSIIAAQLPGRTDNDIKNYWNTKLKKKLLMGSSLMVPPHKIRSLHQQSSISFLQSPSSPFKCTSNNGYNPYSTLAAARSNFASDYNYETVSNLNTQSSNLLMNMETQDEFVGPMQNLYQGKLDSPVFMFGAGDRAGSCSSSDGSNCNNKEYQVDQYEQFMMFSNGSGGNIIDDEKQINGLMFKGDDQSTPLDQYNSLEEIKQLISTNYISCNSSNLNFFVDENRDY